MHHKYISFLKEFKRKKYLLFPVSTGAGLIAVIVEFCRDIG
jgi:hypothetical protein